MARSDEMVKHGKQILTVSALVMFMAAGQALAHDDHSHGAANHASLKDERKALNLSPSERAMILLEMRQFLSGIQIMTDALSRDDLKTVAQATKPLGNLATHDVPDSLKAKLPKEFKQIAFAVHSGFDQLAMDAESLGDTRHVQKQLGGILQNCVNCHSMFQIHPMPDKQQ
jgi:hypothetical protein